MHRQANVVHSPKTFEYRSPKQDTRLYRVSLFSCILFHEKAWDFWTEGWESLYAMQVFFCFFFWFVVEVIFCFVLFCLVCCYIKIFAKVWARSRIQNLHLIPAVSRPAKCQKDQNIIIERPYQSVKVLTVILTLDCWGLIPPTFLTNRIFQFCLSFSLSFPVLNHFCYDTGVQISVLYGFANRRCNQQDLVCLNWMLLFWAKWAWTDHKEFTSWRLPGLVPRCAFMQYRVHYKPKEFSQIPVFCGIRLCSELNFKYFSLIGSP